MCKTPMGIMRPLMLTLASLSAVLGCSAMHDAMAASSGTFADQQSAAEARTQLSRWIAPGAAMAAVVRRLGEHGFSCRAAGPVSSEARDSMLCVYATPAPVPPSERATAPATQVNWFVTLESTDGATVSDFQVARSPTALGE